MRRVVKNVLTCLVGTLLFVSAWAQESESVPEVISVNFGQTLSGDDTVGLMPVAAKQWVCVDNVGGATGGQPAELSSVTLKDQTGKVYPGAKLKVASRGGMWQNGNQEGSLTERLLYNFIDDSNGRNEACVEVTNVPFARYTVYVYFNGDFEEGDANKFPPYEVNGKLYKGNGSTTVQITDFTSGVTAWGIVKKSELQEGQNVLKVTGQSADTLRIYASRYASVEGFTPSSPSGARGCISAIQIVSEDASETSVPTPTFACSFDGDATPAGWFSSWLDETPSAYAPTPVGKGFVVGKGSTPYASLSQRTDFSLALYADISAMPDSDKQQVLISLGDNSDYFALVKNGANTVQVVRTGAPVGNLSIGNVTDGFHLFAFGNDASGSFLSVDGTRVTGAAQTAPTPDGIQVGALLNGATGNAAVGAGMLLDELRGYDTVLTEAQVADLVKTFPANQEAFPFWGRTLTGNAEWLATDAWGTGVNAPGEGNYAALNVASASTLTMNARANLGYLSIGGYGKLTFAGDGTLSSAVTQITTDVDASSGVAMLGHTVVASGKTLTVGAMTLPSLNAAGATFVTVGTGITTLSAMVGAPAAIIVGADSTLVLPENMSQEGWKTTYTVETGATLDVNGTQNNWNEWDKPSLMLADGATLTNSGQDRADGTRQWISPTISKERGTVTVSGNTFGSVNHDHAEHFLTLNSGILTVAMNEGKIFYMSKLTARKTANDAEGDSSEAGTIKVTSGTLCVSWGGDYSRANLVLEGGEVCPTTVQSTFGSLTGEGGTLNLNGKTVTVGALGKEKDTFSGEVRGTGTLKKVGSGTLDLCGAQVQDVSAVALEEGTLILGTLRPKLASVASGTILELTASSAEKRAGQLSLGIALDGVTVKVDGKDATVGDNGTVSFEKDESAVPTWTPTTGSEAWGTATTWTNLTDGQKPGSGTVKIDLSQAPTEITLTLDTPATLDYVELVNGGEKTVTFALGEGVSVAMTELISNAAVSIPAQVIAEATTVKLPGKTLTLTGTCDACNAVVTEAGKVVVDRGVTYTPNATHELNYDLDLAGGTLRSTVGRTCSGNVTLTADSAIICEGGTLTLDDTTRQDLVLNKYRLTKSGGAQLRVAGVDLDSGSIEISGGTLALSGEGGDSSVNGEVTLAFAADTDYVGNNWLYVDGTLTINCASEANVSLDKPLRNYGDDRKANVLKTGTGEISIPWNPDSNGYPDGTLGICEGKVTLLRGGNASKGEITLPGAVTVAKDATLAVTNHAVIVEKAIVNGHVEVLESAELILKADSATETQTQTLQSLKVAQGGSVTLIGTGIVVADLLESQGAFVYGDGNRDTHVTLKTKRGDYPQSTTGGMTVKSAATLTFDSGDTNKTLQDSTDVTVEEGGVVELKTGYIFAHILGEGEVKATGSFTFGFGGGNSILEPATLTVAEGASLGLRNSNDFITIQERLCVDGTLKRTDNSAGHANQVTLREGATLSGKGSITVNTSFAAGAVVDATAGVPTLTQAVTLPTEGIVSVKAPAEGHGTVLTANDLDAAKFALVEGSARQALTATASALVLMQLPEGVDVSSAAGKAILAAANAANVTNVEKVEGDDIDGAALFTDVVTVAGTTATVAYDFGISRMFIRKEGETTYLYIAAKVSTDYAGNTTVKVFQDGTEVEATPVTEGVPNEAGVKWLRVAYPADTFGTHHYTIQAASAEP